MPRAAMYQAARFGVAAMLIASALAMGVARASSTSPSRAEHGYRTQTQVKVLYAFTGSADGALPTSALLAGAGGALYGTTQSGGIKNRGTVFKLSPSGSGYAESVLYAFLGGKNDGALPIAGLVADASGALYGTTVAGGIHSAKRQCWQILVSYYGCGTIFRLTPSSSSPTGYSESIIYRFRGFPDSFWPLGGLSMSGGALYGSTNWGGSPDGGTIFSVTPQGKRVREQMLFAFPHPSSGPADPDGFGPTGNVLTDGAGALYGTAQLGGSCPSQPVWGCGTVFKLVPSASGYAVSFVYAFQAGNDGHGPLAGLVEDKSGALYGTTEYGGSANLGTVFKLTPSASGYTESVIHSFGGGADGALASAPLIVQSGGSLLGTTPSGGAANDGTIFKLTPSGSTYSEHVLYAFRGASDGAEPMAGLVACNAGTLCGTTMRGGASGVGTVFALKQ